MSKSIPYDIFVEKVVLRNQLVPQDQMEKAKMTQKRYPEVPLMDILVKTSLISEKYATLIEQKYNKNSEQNSNRKNPSERHSETPGSISTERRMVESSLDRTATLEDFLTEARKLGASHLYIAAQSPVFIRRNGYLEFFNHPALNSADTERILLSVLSADEEEKIKASSSYETCLQFSEHGRYHSCFSRQGTGWEGRFKIISPEVPTFQTLQLPDALKTFTEYKQGLVLITGFKGGGKSSTVAAMIEHINQTSSKHIVTLENHIEFLYTSKKSTINQREIGHHTKSYTQAMRSAIREDADILFIDELKDYETASLAIEAAESGLLVFSTLYTIDAAQSVMRLLDFFPVHQHNVMRILISDALRGIICQRLIPKTDRQSRALALEVLFNLSSISTLVRDNKIFQIKNIMRLNQSRGMVTMDNSIKELLENKIIPSEEAHFAMVDSLLFQQPKTGRF
jgi:twitching motility protein PilT